MDRRSSAISGTVTLETSFTLVEREVTILIHIQARLDQDLLRLPDRLSAIRADGAHEPLGENAVQCGYKVVWIDAHIQKASKNVDNVIRVNRRKDKVTR